MLLNQIKESKFVKKEVKGDNLYTFMLLQEL
jgi:hypothetical protein